MYFDVKHIDPEIHRQLTGADNRLILENLHKIAAFGVPIIVRTPVIPGYNDSDENIMGIAEMLRSIGRVESYELLAYHKLGESKYHALGRTYPVAESKGHRWRRGRSRPVSSGCASWSPRPTAYSPGAGKPASM